MIILKALLRRHEAFEADMKAIQERVDTLNEQTPKILEEHEDAKDQITSTSNAINLEWEGLKNKQKRNRESLKEHLEHLNFLQKVDNHSNWLKTLGNHFDQLEVSSELATIDAQSLQHQENWKVMQVKHEELDNILKIGQELPKHRDIIEEKSGSLQKQSDDLDEKWKKVKEALDEGADLARFERDCES